MFHTHCALQIENMVCTTTKCNYFFFFTWCSGAACFCAVALSKTYQKGKQEIRLLQPACSEHIAHLFTHKYKPVHNVSAQNLKQLPKLWTKKCHSTDDWCRCLSSIATRPWIAKPLNVSILPIIARRWCQLHRVPSMWFHFTANEPSVTNSIHIEPVISQLKMISWWYFLNCSLTRSPNLLNSWCCFSIFWYIHICHICIMTTWDKKQTFM